MAPLFEVAVSFISGVVIPLVPLVYKHRQEKKRQAKKDIVLSHIEIQIKNQEILDEVRSKMNADRISIFKFSNGTDFLDNTHMLSMTMTSESNNNDFPNIKQDFQRIPAYIFDRILNLLKINEYYVETNADMEHKDVIVNLRKSYDVETVIGVKLYDKRGKWIGILSVGFNKNSIVSNDDITWICLKSKSLN